MKNFNKKQRSAFNFVVSAVVVVAALWFFTGRSKAPKQGDLPLSHPATQSPAPHVGTQQLGVETSSTISGSANVPANVAESLAGGLPAGTSLVPKAFPADRVTVTEGEAQPPLPADLQAQLNAPPAELPEDLKRQLNSPPPELPADLKAQLNAPPQELPDDIKKALQIPPRIVSIDEVNNPNGVGRPAPSEPTSK